MSERLFSKQNPSTAARPDGGTHAVVIGGSLAGLLAARVLVDHFDFVTVVERDIYPENAPALRRGVPQSRHVHVLMQRGRRVLEQLFPGLSAELMAAGALEIDMAGETRWLTPAGWGARYDSDLKMLTFTRELLDWHVRCRLTAHERVRWIVGCEVSRLLPASDREAVAGVAIRSRRLAGAEGVDERVLSAALVVDAAGRGSQAPRWLRELGYAPPAETVVSAFLGYASRLYRRPPEFKSDWKSVYLQAAPPERTRGAVLFPVEDERWLLTLCGGDKDYPPLDEAGFLEFARSLPSPLVYDTIKDAEPLSSIYGFRATENRWRHYEEIERLPENFLAVGDAACAFNPVYGQGMSIAALGALALDESLRQHKLRPDGGQDGLARSFQKRLAKVNAAPWLLATSEDLRYSEAVGAAPTLKTRLLHRYMDAVVRLSTENPQVRQLLLETFHMLRPPSALFSSGVVWQLLKQTFSVIPSSQPTAKALTPSRRTAGNESF